MIDADLVLAYKVLKHGSKIRPVHTYLRTFKTLKVQDTMEIAQRTLLREPKGIPKLVLTKMSALGWYLGRLNQGTELRVVPLSFEIFSLGSFV